MQEHDLAHGLIVVDKPQGPTSHDIVAQARKLLRTRRIGHTGTLDPMATGVLVLLVGEATKLSCVLGSDEKLYRARVQFGFSTDTDDAMGSPIFTAPVQEHLMRKENIDRALASERERTQQTPPVFSAIKQSGQPLYRKARLGLPVSAAPRPVAVKALDLIELGADYLELEIHSSKGYYVRSLARDLGEALNCPAHLSALRRIRAGRFGLDQAIPWPPDSPPPLMSLVSIAHATLACFELTDAGAQKAKLGQELGAEHFIASNSPGRADSGSMAWLHGDQLVAIGRWKDALSLRVERGFNAQ
jgi:tRNA pseudouridine55 synthase